MIGSGYFSMKHRNDDDEYHNFLKVLQMFIYALFHSAICGDLSMCGIVMFNVRVRSLELITCHGR